MFKFVTAAAAALTLAVPAFAHAEVAPKNSFTYNGVEFSYTSETHGDVRVVKGSAYQGRVPFELRVTKTGVTGTFDGEPVSFALRDVKGLDAALLATR